MQNHFSTMFKGLLALWLNDFHGYVLFLFFRFCFWGGELGHMAISKAVFRLESRQEAVNGGLFFSFLETKS